MKKKIVISLTLMLSLSVMGAMAQSFETGSSMMNSGSNYSSTVNEIGATNAADMAFGTAAAPNRGRTFDGETQSTDLESSDESPIGDAVPFLLLLAAGVAVFRWRKQQA